MTLKVSKHTRHLEKRSSGNLETYCGCCSFQRWYFLLSDLALWKGFQFRYSFHFMDFVSHHYTKKSTNSFLFAFGSINLNMFMQNEKHKWRSFVGSNTLQCCFKLYKYKFMPRYLEQVVNQMARDQYLLLTSHSNHKLEAMALI